VQGTASDAFFFLRNSLIGINFGMWFKSVSMRGMRGDLQVKPENQRI
jgi:hypothetical protein